jgi:hypothetical protein
MVSEEDVFFSPLLLDFVVWPDGVVAGTPDLPADSEPRLPEYREHIGQCPECGSVFPSHFIPFYEENSLPSEKELPFVMEAQVGEASRPNSDTFTICNLNQTLAYQEFLVEQGLSNTWEAWTARQQIVYQYTNQLRITGQRNLDQEARATLACKQMVNSLNGDGEVEVKARTLLITTDDFYERIQKPPDSLALANVFRLAGEFEIASAFLKLSESQFLRRLDKSLSGDQASPVSSLVSLVREFESQIALLRKLVDAGDQGWLSAYASAPKANVIVAPDLEIAEGDEKAKTEWAANRADQLYKKKALGEYISVTEEGGFRCVLGLFLESTDGSNLATLKNMLGVEFLPGGTRMYFPGSSFEDELLGEVSDLVIEEIIKPQAVESFGIQFESWEPLYLDGDDAEIVGIYCTGLAKSQIKVPNLHSFDCPPEDACSMDCSFNQAWWDMNVEIWNELDLVIRHQGKPGVVFRGWLLSPPEF